MDFYKMINDYLMSIATVSVADTINQGRQKAYGDYVSRIVAYQWSAILDERVCPICRELDGMYFSPNDPLLEYIRPPIHLHCRCILVGVLREETQIQPIEIHTLTNDEVADYTRNKFWI